MQTIPSSAESSHIHNDSAVMAAETAAFRATSDLSAACEGGHSLRSIDVLIIVANEAALRLDEARAAARAAYRAGVSRWIVRRLTRRAGHPKVLLGEAWETFAATEAEAEATAPRGAVVVPGARGPFESVVSAAFCTVAG